MVEKEQENAVEAIKKKIKASAGHGFLLLRRGNVGKTCRMRRVKRQRNREKVRQTEPMRVG